MALYRSPFNVTLWPSSCLKKYGPMIPPAHKAHQTVSVSGCNGVSTYTCGLASLQMRQFWLLTCLKNCSPLEENIAIVSWKLCAETYEKMRHLSVGKQFSTGVNIRGDTPEITDEILTTARDLESEVNEDAIEELILGHEDQLTIEELQEILNEEHQETQRNISPSEQEEDERGPMPTSVVKDLLKK
ncbi:uncharacterized protein TNCV_999201 [Trichonephila clavipes]|nr:uncharacterized protein TNCV_999201 [Trichonephila clavipes]